MVNNGNHLRDGPTKGTKLMQMLKTLALAVLASTTFACAAQDRNEGADDMPAAAEAEDGVKVAGNLGNLQGSIPDNKYVLTFHRGKDWDDKKIYIRSTYFETIDSCVTPGQAHGDVSAEAVLDRHIELSVNLPAQRNNSAVCAGWFNQTLERGHFQGYTSRPSELNLALRGNLHITFEDGFEMVHQVVLGQGHWGMSNNWWVALEDVNFDSPSRLSSGEVCWDAGRHSVCH
jgi:hypothetical protein